MLKSNPLVSVIIPNYNHARYLRERIESVLAQTYQNIEVILLDDASTDSSKEIIAEFAHHEKVSHVVLNEANTGNTFVQWERGFSLANGYYVWVAESDDVAEPLFLERVVGKMIENDAVLGFSGSKIIDGRGVDLHRNIDGKMRCGDKGIYDGQAFARKFLIFDNRLYNASMIVFRRDVLPKISERFKESPIAGDWLFWFEVCRQGTVVRIPEPLNYSRQHTNKVSSRAKEGNKCVWHHAKIQRIIIDNVQLSPYAMRVLRGYNLKHSKPYNIPLLSKEYPEQYAGNWIDELIYECDKLTGKSGLRKR